MSKFDATPIEACSAAPVAQAVPAPGTLPAGTPQPAQPQVVYVQQPAQPQGPVDYRLQNRGIDQANGHYEQESYCGILSVLIGVFLFPCICCCPCDQREVWVDNTTGRKVVLAQNAL